PLMDMDFAISCPLVRRWRLVSGFCPSTRTFVPCFLQTPPRGGSPCIITRPYLHQVDQRTFTSKLLSMPSTQRSRVAADVCACVVDASRPSKPIALDPASSKPLYPKRPYTAPHPTPPCLGPFRYSTKASW